MKGWRSTMGAAAVAALAFASAAGAQTPSAAEVAEWRQAAERGEPWAQNKLGEMYDYGEGVPENNAEAIRWFQLAAEQGDASAQFNLGSMYANGEGVPKDDAEGLRWFRLAAEQGHVIATFNVITYCNAAQKVDDIDNYIAKLSEISKGNFDYINNSKVSNEFDDDRREFFKFRARRELGYLYAMGNCVSRDIGLSIAYYTAALDTKDEAQLYLTANDLEVLMLRLAGHEGRVPQIEQAKFWATFAAENGAFDLRFNASDLIGEGPALALWIAAAETGDAEAQSMVGSMYASGDGVPENDAEAVRWYRLAADQGDAFAQFILGVSYYHGDGVPKNGSEAARWFRLAAEQGNAWARRSLGLLYAKGEGVPANYVEAHRWLALAAAQGDEEALLARDQVQQWMTPAQVAEAQALASAWRPGGGAASADAARPDDAFARAKPAPDPAVRSIQMGLGVLGYDVGPADGFDGPKTQAAIAAFGADFNVDVEALTPSDLAIAIGAAIGLTSARETEPETDDRAGEAILTGSGFFVSADGHLVTNAHVVEGCARVTTNAGAAATPVAIEAGVDLALLRVADWAGPAARLRQGRGVRLGDDVVVVGYPLSGLLSSGPSVTTGSVSALAGPGDDRRFLQISAPVQPGNSGGPALDRGGAIVGVVVAKLNAASTLDAAGALPENVNFAVSLGALQAFLDAHGVDYALADPGADLGTADVAALATPYTVQLTCEG